LSIIQPIQKICA